MPSILNSLNKNDIIKIGKIKFSFNEFNIDGIDKIKYENKENSYNLSLLNSKTDPLFNMIYDAERVDLNNNEKIICNICYSDENTEENPLINLCHCNGGMKFSHFNCIKLWIKTKLIIKENSRKNVKSYNFTSFNCKICKTPFPFKFRIKDKNNNMNKIYSLIDIEKPEFENYLVLESLDQINENNNFKTIHVITLNEENFIIGRGHECDIRINDISVSRVMLIKKL